MIPDSRKPNSKGHLCRLSISVFCLLHAAVPIQAEQAKLYDRSADPHPFTIFMKEGGWCWFQDPRAIIHDDKLFMGAVRGNGNGEAKVGVYDLAADKPLGEVTLHQEFDRDDHNAPVFYPRPDGSVLAVYARHNRDRYHYSRVSDPKNPLKWSPEVKHLRNSPNPRDQVTYMNLYSLEKEGRLYNFYRGIDFNPTFVSSSDQGLTWSEPTHFLKSEVNGRHRPYARYAGNKVDTIHASITDAHPRNFGNGIYYFAFRNGTFYRADGTFIKSLKEHGALMPSEAELVYKGPGTPYRADDLSAIGAAWTSSIMVDEKDHPHIGYTVYMSNEDHRYRIASWNGKKWIDREVAYAGKCLYDRESSYTGLISIDPVDPSVVFISTDVDPNTGKDDGGQHEIYRAKIGPSDDLSTIKWQAVTKDSPVRNLRPAIVRDGDRRVVLWLRGGFLSYTDYQLDVVGLIEETK